MAKRNNVQVVAVATERAAPVREVRRMSPQDVQQLLQQIDLEALSRRVGEHVAETAETYRRANARAAQECGQIVLI